MGLFKKIRATRLALRKWNKQHFGVIQQSIRRVQEHLALCQKSEANRMNLDLEISLKLELDEQLRREEVLWWQKARETWLTSSELNT